MNPYNNLSPQSKVWIYQSNRNITEAEVEEMNQALQAFTKEWAAHGTQLKAYGKVAHQRFIVLLVDQAMAGASGCSIDSSVHFVQSLGSKYDIDFFRRTDIAYQAGETIEIFPMNEVNQLLEEGKIQLDTIIFNNLVKTKQELEENWLIPLKESWLKSRIKSTTT